MGLNFLRPDLPGFRGSVGRHPKSSLYGRSDALAVTLVTEPTPPQGERISLLVGQHTGQ